MVGIFRFHTLYTRCIMVQTNIKMGYNSESKNERDYIIGGPCRPFVGLSIARCPHFEILPGKNPHGLNFPFHILCTRCIVVRTNIKLSYNSDSIHERDYTLNGLCRPFVGLSIARYPHFEILPGNKSAWFEFPRSMLYIHTLYNGANEYQTELYLGK